MRVEALNYMLAVVHFGSFAKAAKALYISEQGLSKAIKNLESELGVKLFEKRGRNLALTEPGEIVVGYARTIESAYHGMTDDLAQYELSIRQAESDGQMELHVMPYLSNGLLKMIEQPMDAYGLNNCLIREVNYYDFIYQLENNALAGLTLVGLLERDYHAIAPMMTGNIEFTPLFSTEILAAGAPPLFPTDIEALTAFELAEYPLVQYNEQVLNRFAKELFKNVPPEKMHLMQHTSNSGKIINMLREGLAVSFSDSFSAYAMSVEHHSKSAVAVVRIIPRHLVYVGFVRNRESLHSTRHLDYIDRFMAMLDNRFGSYVRSNTVPCQAFNSP